MKAVIVTIIVLVSLFIIFKQDVPSEIKLTVELLWGIAIYLLPTWMAYKHKKKNFNAICALNILLGWTIIGWVVALVWAMTVENSTIK